MDKQQLIETLSGKLKLVRVEKGYTQDQMAEVLGVSKKTLVQIEKERMLAGWTNVVALCALFRDSQVIQSVLGGDPVEVIETIAHNGFVRSKDKTFGGKVWWKEEEKKGSFRIQLNMISHHYRIIDDDDFRWFSSFDREETLIQLEKLSNRM
ncbi:helix-turn-helix transcriptional regulator [Paenibacillus sp. Soil522]|uniref:helix-turn-helix transcriptional regulator n=1 Tax=Paenibacillus sp. Soil522 TaxID=1736388 RepID=UPI000700086F|nr:helix-turn-helix domain-containing protein [Paenibacillus sp. Soil522]KRE44990.1 XRE family transcriptional regulator [Paenibacillus sp. Soil522]